MLKYELVIIWYNGEKEIHAYNTKEKAEEIGQGMKMAFGNQVQWYGVRKKI